MCSEIYHFAVHDLDNDKERLFRVSSLQHPYSQFLRTKQTLKQAWQEPAEEAEAEEQEEAENGEEEEHPETKQQWNEFRKKHKNLHLVDLLYSDRLGQLQQ